MTSDSKGGAGRASGVNMWGGHFDSAPSDLMQEINASIDFDKYLQPPEPSVPPFNVQDSSGLHKQEIGKHPLFSLLYSYIIV